MFHLNMISLDQAMQIKPSMVGPRNLLTNLERLILHDARWFSPLVPIFVAGMEGIALRLSFLGLPNADRWQDNCVPAANAPRPHPIENLMIDLTTIESINILSGQLLDSVNPSGRGSATVLASVEFLEVLLLARTAHGRHLNSCLSLSVTRAYRRVGTGSSMPYRGLRRSCDWWPTFH